MWWSALTSARAVTEDVSGDEVAELCDTVESAALDATGAAEVMVDGAGVAAEA